MHCEMACIVTLPNMASTSARFHIAAPSCLYQADTARIRCKYLVNTRLCLRHLQCWQSCHRHCLSGVRAGAPGSRQLTVAGQDVLSSSGIKRSMQGYFQFPHGNCFANCQQSLLLLWASHLLLNCQGLVQTEQCHLDQAIALPHPSHKSSNSTKHREQLDPESSQVLLTLLLGLLPYSAGQR